MGIANNRRKVGHRRLWRMAEEKFTRKLYYTDDWCEARCISVWLFVCKRISWYWRQCARVSYSYGFVTAKKIIVNHSCGEVRWLAYRLRWRTSVVSDSLECSWTREGCRLDRRMVWHCEIENIVFIGAEENGEKSVSQGYNDDYLYMYIVCRFAPSILLQPLHWAWAGVRKCLRTT